MRMIITLSAVGLTLACGEAALSKPVDHLANPAYRPVFLDRKGHGNEQLRDYYRHKRYYRHDQSRPRDQSSGTIRLPRRRDRDDVGTVRPEEREPMVRARPLLGVAG